MADGNGPLSGVRVIDPGRHQAGPRCAQVLARLGAEVIKIERLGGEETRYHGPWVRKRTLLADMTMKEAIAHFTRHDVVAAPVNTIPQAAQDSHPWERRAMVTVPDFLAGSIAVSGDFWHFSRTPAVVASTPAVGEHNEEVLGLLGHSKEEIADLYAKDVIGNSHHYDSVPG